MLKKFLQSFLLLVFVFLTGCTNSNIQSNANQNQLEANVAYTNISQNVEIEVNYENILQDYFNYLNSENYLEAYNLLGANLQATNYKDWKDGYKNTLEHKIDSLDCFDNVCDAKFTALEKIQNKNQEVRYNLLYTLNSDTLGNVKIEKGEFLSKEIVNQITDEDVIAEFLGILDERALDVTKGDLNQNGIDDYLVEAVSNNCGSCHTRPLYIFENQQLIFKYIGDDYSIVDTANNQIKIREPIRLDSEPYCCPSSYQFTIVNCPAVSEEVYCRVDDTFPEEKKKEVNSVPSAPITIPSSSSDMLMGMRYKVQHLYLQSLQELQHGVGMDPIALVEIVEGLVQVMVGYRVGIKFYI